MIGTISSSTKEVKTLDYNLHEHLGNVLQPPKKDLDAIFNGILNDRLDE